ncbi:MAG TPA: hypothetical protein VFM18_02800 [Methanosarcina sp.]|nr:hypothetical protein [Methanosarcina sp.]
MSMKITLTSKALLEVVQIAFDHGLPLYERVTVLFERYMDISKKVSDKNYSLHDTEEYKQYRAYYEYMHMNRFDKICFRISSFFGFGPGIPEVPKFQPQSFSFRSCYYFRPTAYDVSGKITEIMKRVSDLKNIALIDGSVVEIEESELKSILSLSDGNFLQRVEKLSKEVDEMEKEFNEHVWLVDYNQGEQ